MVSHSCHSGAKPRRWNGGTMTGTVSGAGPNGGHGHPAGAGGGVSPPGGTAAVVLHVSS